MADPEAKRYPIGEDELSRFADLGRQAGTLIVVMHARIAERMGLSGTDHKALDLLSQLRESLAAGRIAELLGLSTGAVTGIIDRLERGGFVRRVHDLADRRKVLVEIVSTGEERFAPLFDTATEATRGVLENFSPAEREVIERYQNAMTTELRNEVLGTSEPA